MITNENSHRWNPGAGSGASGSGSSSILDFIHAKLGHNTNGGPGV